MKVAAILSSFYQIRIKKMMLDYPFKNGEYPVVEAYLTDNPDQLINLNLFFRGNGYKGKGWFKCLYIIGGISQYDLFFIDLSNIEKEYIYFLSDERRFNHKKINQYLYSDNFEEFIEQCKLLQKIHNNP